MLGKEERDRIGAAGLRQLHRAINDQIRTVATKAGAADDLAAARSFFAREVVPRYRTNFARRILDDARTSGEQLVTRAANMTVRDAQNIRRMVTRFAQDAGTGLSPQQAIQEWRAGVLGSLFQRAVNPTTGILQPRRLASELGAIQPEIKAVILGDRTADAVEQFAKRLAETQSRITLGVGVTGTGALATMGAMRAGGLGAAASIEAANELNFLGRLFVGNARMTQRLMRRVIRGEPEALRDFTALTGIRIGATQAGRPQGLPTPPPFPETASQPIQ